MKKLIPILVTIIFASTSFGQSIGSDSRGKDIFIFFQGEGFKPSISASSAKLSYSHAYGVTQYFAQGIMADSNETTKDEYSFNFSLGISNIAANLDNLFSSLNQPTLTMSVGWSLNNIEEFSNWRNLYRHRGWLRERQYNLSAKVYWNAPFFNYYDTTGAGQQYSNNPHTMWKLSSVGVQVTGTLFYLRWFALTGNLSTEYGFPVDNIKNYQDKSPLYFQNANIISLGNFNGKIGGNIEHKSWNSRASLALPLFIKSFFRKVNDIVNFGDQDAFSKVCLIPYYSPFGSLDKKWTQLVGLFLEYLKSGYGGLHSTVSSGFGIGIDWQTKTTSKFTGPNIFVAGTFDLSKPTSSKNRLLQPRDFN
jgi:hypothetical protein